MIKHKAITDELLRIAYLPSEDRNRELETLKNVLDSYSENEMPKVQRDLVQEIIQDLINENTSYEGQQKPKPKAKKAVTQIKVNEPEIIKPEPEKKPEPVIKAELENEELTIEDIDDAF
jgi:hypothetical protein